MINIKYGLTVAGKAEGETMIKFISSNIPKPFARITVGNSHCIVRVDEAPRILRHEPEDATLELVWMSERRFNGLSEATGF